MIQQATAQMTPQQLREYNELLERVNQQLALTWTPWSIVFTGLAVLVAIVSVVVGVLFYFQGREYRAQLQKVISQSQAAFNEWMQRHKSVVDTLLAEQKAKFEEMKTELQKLRTDAVESADKSDIDARIATMEKRLLQLQGESDTIAEAAKRLDPSTFAAYSAMGRTLVENPTFDPFSTRCRLCHARIPLELVAHAKKEEDGIYMLQCPNCDRQTPISPVDAVDAKTKMQVQAKRRLVATEL